MKCQSSNIKFKEFCVSKYLRVRKLLINIIIFSEKFIFQIFFKRSFK